tara:strand:+ start:1367 stop:1825 length:459 start_codon:yes stop_codon:yes gene_type:complete
MGNNMWSYDPTNLDTATVAGRLNATRLLVGDTQTIDQQVQDEEVSFALSQNNNNIYYSGGWLARVISSKYSRKVDTELSGALKASYSDLAAQYKSLADSLEYQGKTSGAAMGVLAGGITVARTEAVRANTNRVKPAFRKGQFNNPQSYVPEF